MFKCLKLFLLQPKWQVSNNNLSSQKVLVGADSCCGFDCISQMLFIYGQTVLFRLLFMSYKFENKSSSVFWNFYTLSA